MPIDLTTRSGKYRIVEESDHVVVYLRSGARWIEDCNNPRPLLELCTELEGLREYARSAVNVWIGDTTKGEPEDEGTSRASAGAGGIPAAIRMHGDRAQSESQVTPHIPDALQAAAEWLAADLSLQRCDVRCPHQISLLRRECPTCLALFLDFREVSLRAEIERLKVSMVSHFQREHLEGDGPEIDRWKLRVEAAEKRCAELEAEMCKMRTEKA